MAFTEQVVIFTLHSTPILSYIVGISFFSFNLLRVIPYTTPQVTVPWPKAFINHATSLLSPVTKTYSSAFLFQGW